MGASFSIVTVPVLFDKKTHQIVNNESADIIRMLNNAHADSYDLAPAELLPDIDNINASPRSIGEI